MLWLYIIIGVFVVVFLALEVSAILIARLAIINKGPWNTDNNDPHIKSFPKDLKEISDRNVAWYQNNGEWVSMKTNDGINSFAKVFVKEGAKKTIILVHGYRGFPEADFSIINDWLRTLNVNLIYIRHRASTPCDGKRITMGVFEKEDIHMWSEYAHHKFGGDIYLFGVSMGCATILMSLDKKYPDYVKGIVADCGFSNIYDQYRFMVEKYLGKPLSHMAMFLCRPWVYAFGKFHIKKWDIPKILRKCENKIPAFFAHGKADQFVLPYHTERNFEAYPGNKKIILVEHAYHGMSYAYSKDEYQKNVLEILGL